MLSDPIFDEKGIIESQYYYKFPGSSLISPGEEGDPFELFLDTLKSPFDEMHEMTSQEIREGMRELLNSA